MRPRSDGELQRHEYTPMPDWADVDLKAVHAAAKRLRNLCRETGFTCLAVVLPNDFAPFSDDPLRQTVVMVGSGEFDLMTVALAEAANYLTRGLEELRPEVDP